VIVDACLGEAAREEMGADLRVFVESRGVAREDADAIAAAPARLAVYRSLVQNGIRTIVGRVLPRTRARLNAACGGRFDADLARFLDLVGPRTHYLRDVPHELTAWAIPQWRADPTVPAYLPDLAVYEGTPFAVASAPDDAPFTPAGVALDRPLHLSSSIRLLHLSWRVDELPEDVDANGAPAAGPAHLLAYRQADHGVHWLELTPLAASIADGLVTGRNLGDAVEAACRDHGTIPSAVTSDVARLLADLADREILLGAR